MRSLTRKVGRCAWPLGAALLALTAAPRTSSAVAAPTPEVGCPWREPETGPEVTVDEGIVFFTQRLDPDWWRCAKAAGTKLRIDTSAKSGARWVPLRSEAIRDARIQEGSFRSGVCDVSPAPSALRFELVGEGEAARLTWTSPEIPIPGMCSRCRYASYENHERGAVEGKHLVLTVELDAKWAECARAGSKLMARVFAGASEAAILAATKPTRVVTLPIAKGKHIEKLPLTELCKNGAKFFTYELWAEGEARALAQPGSRIVYSCGGKR